MSLLNAPREQNWVGCIDFGTALSKAALTRRKPASQLKAKDIVPLAIGVRAEGLARNPFLLPSVVYITKDAVLFGEEAQLAAIREERLGRQAFNSPKQYLSTQELECLDEPMEAEIDPTGQYTPRQLLILFLAHLLVQVRAAAELARAPWPVPLRIARPAWDRNRAVAGERTLQALVICAFAVADQLGKALSASGGVPHKQVGPVLSAVCGNASLTDNEQFGHLFERTDGSRNASILEATAVAAGLIRRTGRRVIVVADIGAGTSDFGAFMTGLAGHHVVGEIPKSSQILREAGDHIDMLLTRHILNDAGIDPDDPAGKGAAARLRVRQRANKEILFSEGQLSVELNDDVRTITREAFLNDRRVQEFSTRLRAKFCETLKVAIECAKQYSPQPTRQAPIEIILTGGGSNLPMVRCLSEEPPLSWRYAPSSRELIDLPMAPELLTIGRQLAVAIGGAVRDIPQQTAPVRL